MGSTQKPWRKSTIHISISNCLMMIIQKIILRIQNYFDFFPDPDNYLELISQHQHMCSFCSEIRNKSFWYAKHARSKILCLCVHIKMKTKESKKGNIVLCCSEKFFINFSIFVDIVHARHAIMIFYYFITEFVSSPFYWIF